MNQQKPPFKVLIMRRITTETQRSILVAIEGEVTETENFSKKPIPELADAIAKVFTELPRCQKLILEGGKNIRFERIESVTPKDCPVTDNPDKLPLLRTLWSADIL